MTSVVDFAVIAKTLRKTGEGVAVNEFADQGIIDLMQTVLDFHYEDGIGEDGKPAEAEDFMLEDMHVVMSEAENEGASKMEALRKFFNEIISANADEIEESLRAASSH